MKFKHLIISGALPLALFAACSSNESPDAVDPGQKGDENGYIAVRIDLPTVPSTRADGESDPGVTFDDGIPAEYAVSNAAILVFKGNDEYTSTFVRAYDLGSLGDPSTGDLKDNITTSYQKAFPVSGFTSDAKYYALAVVNYKDIMTIDNGFVKFLSTNGTVSGTVGTTTTFSDFNTLTIETLETTSRSGEGFVSASNQNFFMTNSPIFNVAGGKNAPTNGVSSTLVEIDKNKVFSTQEAALQNPAGIINVERAVAKITAKWTQNAKILSIKNESQESKLYVQSVEWTLGNTAKNSYIVRNVKDADWWNYLSSLTTANDKYRFVGSAQMGQTSVQPYVNLFRTYWCYDPHYNGDTAGKFLQGGNFGEGSGAVDALSNTDPATPLYCYENTFDVANQNYKNTTFAYFKVTFSTQENGKGVTFYVKDGYDDVYYLEEAAQAMLKTVIVNNSELKSVFTESLKEGQTDVNMTEYVEVEFKTTEQNVLTVDSVSFTKTSAEIFKKVPQISDELQEKLKNEANSLVNLRAYAEGVAYYYLPIKHFGDTLTPWQYESSNTDSSIISTGVAYPGDNASQNYLGRYGLVRNNWYDISIDGVNKLGDATVPDVNVDTSDDNKVVEQKIAFRINIMSWAKRQQTHVFK